jgi:endogenous inhibitor of DNA gyrase (YacG/DUF329 family)
MKCPICKKEVEPASPYAPFCSDRCRLIDLGNWSAGQYRIPTAPDEEEEDDQDEPES